MKTPCSVSQPMPLFLQLDVPVEPVAPRFVEVVGREALAVLLQLPAGRPDGLQHQFHSRLFGRPSALLHVARRAGGDDVLPCGLAAEAARDDMVEGQVAGAAAILAGEAVAQEQVEAGEGGKFAGLHVLLERDYGG